MSEIAAALVIIFVLYLIDKNKVWRPTLKIVGGLVALALIGWAGLMGWDAYMSKPKFDPTKPIQLLEQHGGAGSTVEIHGGETLQVVHDPLPPPEPSVPLVYLGHGQTFAFACGNYGDKQVPDTFPRRDEHGNTVCP